MLSVFFRILKDRRTITLVYCLASILLLWMYIALYPAFKEQSATMEQMLKSYPEAMLKAFNFDIKSFTTLEGFLSTEQFSFMWPLLAILATVGFAGSAFANEIEKGTIEILLSEPISRAKLFMSRYFAGLFILIIFTIVSVFSALPLAKAYNIEVSNEGFATMALLCFIFAWAIYSLSMFFSAAFSDKGKVFFITGGILVAMYVLNIVAALKESLADLKYGSFFYYFNPTNALYNNKIDHWAYLVFMGTVVMFFALGAIWFSRRDIAT